MSDLGHCCPNRAAPTGRQRRRLAGRDLEVDRPGLLDGDGAQAEHRVKHSRDQPPAGGPGPSGRTPIRPTGQRPPLAPGTMEHRAALRVSRAGLALGRHGTCLARPLMVQAPRVYARRHPQTDPLHQVLSQHLLTFFAQTEQDGHGLPSFVKKELLGYLDCGLLCRGAIRVHCPACDHSIVVALSCKGRGVCPSCGGRRMNDTAAHLCDRVLPDAVPVRQWVLSLPHRYRFLLARDASLLQAVLGIFVKVVFGLLVRMAQGRGIKDGRPGSIVALQRFGDGLAFNTHMHGIFLQGVYHRPVPDQPPVFVVLPPPEQEQVAQVALQIKKRVEKLLRRKGKMPGEGCDPEQAEVVLWDKLCAASTMGRIALGPKAGWRVTRLGGRPVLLPPGPGHLCADADGFNVHAHTSVGAGHKEARERLCRYILRPALCGDRLSLLPSGDVLFRLKRPWSDGTSHLLFKPLEFLEKLAVIVPPPHKHLVTYHGVLWSAAMWRKEIVPGGQGPASQGEPQQDPPDEALPELSAQRPGRLLWAQLLQRTFGLDVLLCPKCGGTMKLVAAVLDPVQIARLCENLGEPTEAPPVVPSRYQAQTTWEFADPP